MTNEASKTSSPRPDWTMPAPPEPGAVPVVELAGGWMMGWRLPDGSVRVGPRNWWPFAEDEGAEADDLAALGFTIGALGEE
jgi:hypothetical protein